MQRRLVAVALAFAGIVIPACAQRGGAIGHSGGGFAAHSAPAFHSSFAPISRTPFMGTPQFSSRFSTRYSAVPQSAGRFMGVGAPAGRSGSGRDYRYRRPYSPYYGAGLPYGYGIAGWIPDALDYSDSASGDNSASAAPQQAPGYGDVAPGYAPGDYQGPLPPSPPAPVSPAVEQAYAPPPPAFRPAYQRPAPEPEADEAAVTLVFKDGRPNEQIHNYMLTRTALYVQDQRLRTIPVDQLDLAAMDKLNKDAGVDFQLPASTR